MGKILTAGRIAALANLSRWNGWTWRPYTVLEHTVIGALALHRMTGITKPMVRAFLLHDVEETEFGEHTRDVKRRFLGSDYHAAVREFDTKLFNEVGVPLSLKRHSELMLIDDGIASVEAEVVVLPEYLVEHVSDDWIIQHRHPEMHDFMSTMIRGETLRGHRAIEAWWNLWAENN